MINPVSPEQPLEVLSLNNLVKEAIELFERRETYEEINVHGIALTESYELFEAAEDLAYDVVAREGIEPIDLLYVLFSQIDEEQIQPGDLSVLNNYVGHKETWDDFYTKMAANIIETVIKHTRPDIVAKSDLRCDKAWKDRRFQEAVASYRGIVDKK